MMRFLSAVACLGLCIAYQHDKPGDIRADIYFVTMLIILAMPKPATK